MTKAEELLALAHRCETEDPSRELDAAIDAEVRSRMTHPDLPKGYTMARGADHRLARAPYITRDRGPAPAYTTSLDSAVSLKPAGWRFRNMDEGEPTSRHLQPCAEIIPLYGNDAVWTAYTNACGERGRIMGFGKTLPSALTAAALRARAAIEQDQARFAPHPSRTA